MSKPGSTEREPRTDVERKTAARLEAALLAGDGPEALRLRRALEFLQSGPPLFASELEAKRARRPIYMSFTGAHGITRDEHGRPISSSTLGGLITAAWARLSRLFSAANEP